MVIDFPQAVRGVILPYPNGINEEMETVVFYCKMFNLICVCVCVNQ